MSHRLVKIQMSVHQSKANLNGKVCLVKSHIFTTQQVEICVKGVCMGIENSTFHSGL